MNYEDITAKEFAELMNKKDHVVLDVRSPEEIEEGFVPGYKMINFYGVDFLKKISQLDKNKSYLVYCRSGNRSGQVCGLMSSMGFKNLYNLEGGIGAWNAYQVMS